jgi:uncharacterized C2H2 Zn-finger protein
LPHKKRIPKKLKNVKTAEKVHRCGKCGETFANQAALTSHRLTHSKKQQQQTQQQHHQQQQQLLLQQQQANFSCQLCNKGFPTQIKFFEHLKSHYEPIKIDHEEGDIQGVQQQEEPQQQQIHHQQALHEQEDTKMVHTSVIVQEMLPAALPPPLACCQCNKVFRRQKALDSHINLAHPQVSYKAKFEVYLT